MKKPGWKVVVISKRSMQRRWTLKEKSLINSSPGCPSCTSYGTHWHQSLSSWGWDQGTIPTHSVMKKLKESIRGSDRLQGEEQRYNIAELWSLVFNLWSRRLSIEEKEKAQHGTMISKSCADGDSSCALSLNGTVNWIVVVLSQIAHRYIGEKSDPTWLFMGKRYFKRIEMLC